MSKPPDLTVLFFDGVCALCNGFVQFLVQTDRGRRLRYAPLQSELYQNLLSRFPELQGRDSFVAYVRRDGTEAVYFWSDAVLWVFSQLPPPWSWLTVMRIVPRPWRDVIYRWVAATRYRIFGQNTTCRRPTPQERELFLDERPVDEVFAVNNS